MTRLLLSVSIGLLLTAGTVWACPFEYAAAAYKRSTYAAVFKIIQPLAAQGNAEALYEMGQGVRQDYVLARQWFEKAAAQGDAGAALHLGELDKLGK
jgi:uncharacterized protein